MQSNKTQTALTRGSRLTDAKLLLIITICVFAVMYVCAVPRGSTTTNCP